MGFLTRTGSGGMHAHEPILSVVIGSCNQLNPLKFTLLALRDQQPDLPH